MLTTRFTELVGCSIPIQQAGMSSVGMPPLAGEDKALLVRDRHRPATRRSHYR
jgi:hypothetical protein